MNLAPKEVTIGDRRFILSPLPAWRAYKLSARLGKVAGAAVLSAFMGGGLRQDALPSVTAFFDRLTPEELEAITRELLDGSSMIEGGKSVEVLSTFDVIFQGRLHEVIQLVKEALALNYADSFSSLRAAGSAKLQAASNSTSPKS